MDVVKDNSSLGARRRVGAKRSKQLWWQLVGGIISNTACGSGRQRVVRMRRAILL